MSKEILDLIESVDPEDSAALDEIDARFWCFLYGTEFEKCFRTEHEDQGLLTCYQPREGACLWNTPNYTQSRDALKAIRPEGWWCTSDYFCVSPMRYKPRCIMMGDGYHSKKPHLRSPGLPTEELAELHAIIQAIQWERDNEATK